ncbi:MAG: zinc ribbon domain-containing protein [Methanomicrobia archaeon]|nr:zinc ribbon domain-containing protein [Methanomicrobia archaeon]
MEFKKKGEKIGIFDKSKSHKKASIDTSFNKFLRHALKRPAYCRIKISQIAELYNALTDRLMKERYSHSKIVTLVGTNLKGVCPECGSWYSSEGLSMCGITKSSPLYGKTFFITGSHSQTVERILRGHCINPRCSCKEIVICWQVEEEGVGITYADAALGLGLSKGSDPYDVWNEEREEKSQKNDTLKCKNCGFVNKEGSNFCENCGSKLE